MAIAITLITLTLIVIGLIGAVIQVVPSGPVTALGVLIWAIYVNNALGWVVFATSLAILAISMVAKYLFPGRQLTQSGIPNSAIIWGLIGAIVGYFIIPVVGFIVGLIVAIYVVEFLRLGNYDLAKSATIKALKAVGFSIAIEVLAVLLVASTWAGAALYMAFA